MELWFSFCVVSSLLKMVNHAKNTHSDVEVGAFSKICVPGAGLSLGSQCDVASRWCFTNLPRKMLELVKLSEIMIVSARLAFRWCFSFAYGVGGVAMAAVAVLLFAAA